MQLNDNTVLITGGGSGIGRALAEAFHARGNRVVIAGRRERALDEVTAANPGMGSAVLDVGDAGSMKDFADRLGPEYPDLNVVVHSADIMRAESVRDGKLDDAEATVATDLLGPIRLTGALLPLLLARPRAAIVTVSSGLAFVPMAATPTYNATKAAVHSYTESLRYQLRGTSVEVLEIVPPYVRTSLMGERQANDPNAMPLGDFVAETMRILETSPEAAEIVVERAMPLRYADANGRYDAFFERLNAAASR